MRIVKRYSHLNAFEYLNYHRPYLWIEVENVIQSIDAEKCRVKESKEARKQDRLLLSPIHMNAEFKKAFKEHGWESRTVSNWISDDAELLRKIVNFKPENQKKVIAERGLTPIFTMNQTDFVKDGCAVEVQLGKYSFVAHDLHVKHLTFFQSGAIDVGIEILPMKEMERQMSSGVAYYERDLFNLVRQGRASPAVPIILVGIAP